MRNRTKKGFTLIELLIAIAILAILIGIFVPRWARARYQAYLAGCQQNEHNIAIAIESYAVDNQTFPPTLDNLTAGTSKYMIKLPVCPSDPSSDYRTKYQVATDFKTFTLSCPGGHYAQLINLTQGYPQYQSNGTLVTQ